MSTEICSAAFVHDDNIETAVVHSPFGDGAAALAIRASKEPVADGPAICGCASQVIPQALNRMRFELDEGARCLARFLQDRGICA